MKKSHILIAAGAAMGLSAAAMAQNTDRGVWGMGTPDVPGDLIPGSLTDMQGQTGSNGHLGIQYTSWNGGTYWGSARRITGGNHQIHGFDAAGVLGPSIDQVQAAQGSSWGYRDGASDGSFMYFGWENGVARHNLDGTVGTQVFSGTAPGGVGTWRALAWDPTLTPTGGFWVASFGSSLTAVDMSFAAIPGRSYPVDNWSLYGLAYFNGMLYGHSTGGDIIEIDPLTGVNNGVVFNVAGGFTAFAAQGGLSEVPGGGFGSGNIMDLAAVGQGTPDEFGVFELLVPAPGAIALLGMGGLLMTRRRR